MTELRKALTLSTFERYCALVSNFVMLLVVSRLMIPSEIGVYVLGSSLAVIAGTAREFVTPAYLIQLSEIEKGHIQTALTLHMVVSALTGFILVVGAEEIAEVFHEPRLVPYLQIAGPGLALESIHIGVAALLRRHMDFNRLAMIGLWNALASPVIVVVLAWYGLGFMSFAWAWLITSGLAGILALMIWREYSIFRPRLSHTREMLNFSMFNGFAVMTGRLYEAVPYLVLSRVLPIASLALYNRTLTICQIPEKIILGGVVPVLIPAFSAHRRDGGDFRHIFLLAIDYASGLLWPGLLVLAVCAEPVVHLVLGEQWMDIVPYVRIVALACMFSFFNELAYPMLIAWGAGRDLLLRALLIWPASAAIFIVAAGYGLQVLTLAWLITVPLQAAVSLAFVRRHIDLPLRDVFRSLVRAFALGLCAIAGPLAVTAYASGFNLSRGPASIALVLAGAGWLTGLMLLSHPLFDELKGATRIISSRFRKQCCPQHSL